MHKLYNKIFVTNTHVWHTLCSHSVQILKWTLDWACNLFSSHQVHPGSHKMSLRPACTYKLIHRYAYSWLQDAESFLRSWWYLTWTRHSSFFMDSPQFIRKLESVLRLCLLWSTRTSSTTYSISLISIEYYASIYTQVLQRCLFHLRFQNKMYRVIHKSLRDFRTRLRNNQDRYGRKEHINR